MNRSFHFLFYCSLTRNRKKKAPNPFTARWYPAYMNHQESGVPCAYPVATIVNLFLPCAADRGRVCERGFYRHGGNIRVVRQPPRSYPPFLSLSAHLVLLFFLSGGSRQVSGLRTRRFSLVCVPPSRRPPADLGWGMCRETGRLR
jgi:hypothetical protein